MEMVVGARGQGEADDGGLWERLLGKGEASAAAGHHHLLSIARGYSIRETNL